MTRPSLELEAVKVSDNGGGDDIMTRAALRKVPTIHHRFGPSLPGTVVRHPSVARANWEKGLAFLDDMVSANGAAEAERQAIFAERAASKVEVESLQAKIAELELVQRELSAIESSTSWRITRPLRQLVDGISFVRSATRKWRRGLGLPHSGKINNAYGTIRRELLGSLASDQSLAKLDSQEKPNERVGGVDLEVITNSYADLDAKPEGANFKDAGSAFVIGGTELFCESKPHMADNELACFERLLRRANKVLEYGCGGSTVFAASLAHGHIFSVESDPAWLRKVKAQPSVRDAIAAGRVDLKHVNIGPTGEWGVPSDEAHRDLWPRYSQYPWAKGSDYDLIFVDGRFRVACILNAILQASTDALIVVHDFWDRPEYHVVLPFLEWEETSQTLGVFRRRRQIDGASVQALIDDYQYICD